MIAINLNNDSVVRRSQNVHGPTDGALGEEMETGLIEKLSGNLKEWFEPYVAQWLERQDDTPRDNPKGTDLFERPKPR